MITHIGKDSVSQYIKQSGGSKFKIFLENSKTPIYSSSGKTVEQAIKEFNLFSDNILNNNGEIENVYRISIYQPSAGRSTSNTLIGETFFKYSDDPVTESVINSVTPSFDSSLGQSLDFMAKIMNFMKPFAEQKAENEILKQQVEDLENEETEPSTTETILGLLSNHLTPKTEQPVGVAGIEVAEMPETKKELLNTAINKLLKYDSELPNDLYKLSEIAENSPKLFNTIIVQLRNM